MAEDESGKVEAVKLSDGQWHEVKDRSFSTFVADSQTAPPPPGTKPFVWYSFERIDGQKLQGVTTDIKDLRFAED
jgi:hypothetical protein